MKDNFIQNYVMATPSEPPVCHKFREVNKNKWITNFIKSIIPEEKVTQIFTKSKISSTVLIPALMS